MKIKIALLIAVIWILLRLTSHAQERPSTQNFVKPSLQLGSFKADYTYSPFEIGGAEMSIQQSNASLILPVFSRLKEGKPDFLLSGIAYTGLFLHGNNVADDRSAFHSISVPLTYQKTFSKKHAISFSFIPTLSSDLKDISHEDFIYTGAVSLKVKHSESFVYSLGVVYSRQFFGSLFLPLIGIDWQINDKVNLSGSLPVNQKLKYSLSVKNSLALINNLGIGGGTYRLSEELNSGYFQAQQSKMALLYIYTPSKQFSIDINAGYNYVQKLGFYDKNEKIALAPFDSLDDRIPQTEYNKNGISVGIGINYRF